VANGHRPLYEAIDVPDDAYVDGANTVKAIRQMGLLATGENPFYGCWPHKTPSAFRGS